MPVTTVSHIQPPWLMKPSQATLMGILNITPDSFSDGGDLDSLTSVSAQAALFLEHGAQILDVGGESTRPGAHPVTLEEELVRVVPAVQLLSKQFPQALLSVDTRKAVVAKAAVAAGAHIINDVSGGQFDPSMFSVAAETGAFLVIMHTQGTPETMQDNPSYHNLLDELLAFFQAQTTFALAAGVSADRIIIDPGFGFGKTVSHNLALLKGLSYFQSLGYPLLIGTSRKAFLTLGQPQSIPPKERDTLTAVSIALARQVGPMIFRVHDVVAQAPVLRFMDAYLSS